MKKLILLLFIPLTIILNSCANLYSIQDANSNTNGWIEIKVLPSELFKNGEAFFQGQLRDGSTFSIFSEDSIDLDSGYYYNILMKDLGWTYNGEKWQDSSGFALSIKYGALYVHPVKRVAVYIYPQREYSAYKVKITKNNIEY